MKFRFPLQIASYFLISSFLLAADPMEPARSISGQGIMMLKRNPTTMRVTVQFNESGKSIAEALNNLKDRQEAARAQLEKLGAKKESISVSEPSIAQADPNSARMMAAIRNMGRGAGKKGKAGPATPTTVSVQSKISGEWALPSEGIEEILTFVTPLQDKIAAADLAGLTEKKKQSPQEEELSEEMQMMQQAYNNSNEAQPGEPQYIFIAEMSAEERQKATAAAFEKARANAERLATAAGLKVGKLRSINSGGSDAASNAMQQAMQWSMMRGYNTGENEMGADPLEFDMESTGRSVSNRCGPVPFAFAISAAFEVQ